MSGFDYQNASVEDVQRQREKELRDCKVACTKHAQAKARAEQALRDMTKDRDQWKRIVELVMQHDSNLIDHLERHAKDI
jgi:hypothetical protein